MGQYVNKVIYGSEILIDLTGDTIDEASLLAGKKAHDKTGAQITGTCSYDADTSDATAAEAEVLKDKTAYVSGTKITGTMPNRGAVVGEIASKEEEYAIQQGYHDGSGKVRIKADEQAKIIPGNIKSGVQILGVTGSYGGEQVTAQSKTATPQASEQTVLPDDGYDYLSQVVIAAIPYAESENAAGGKTVTIG